MYEIITNLLNPQEMAYVDFTTFTPMGTIEVKGDGNCVVLLLYSDDGGEVTVEAGDSVFAGGPLTLTVEPSMYYAVQLETGKYMQQTGKHKGKILLTTDVSDMSCTCIQVK